MQQMVTCASCGTQCAAGQRFCTTCGSKLSEVVPPQQTWQPQQPEQAWPPQQQVAQPQEQTWGAQPAPSVPTPPSAEKRAAPRRKYVILSAAVIIFKIIGWVVLIGGILGSIAVGLLASRGGMPGLVSLLDNGMAVVGVSGIAGVGLAVIVLVGIVGSLLWGLGMLAFAELASAVMTVDDTVKAQR